MEKEDPVSAAPFAIVDAKGAPESIVVFPSKPDVMI